MSFWNSAYSHLLFVALSIATSLITAWPTPARAADMIEVEGYSMLTIPGSPDTASAVAVFRGITIDPDEQVLQLPCIFTGESGKNLLVVEFISGSNTFQLTSIAGLATLVQDELDYLILDATSISGKTGDLRFSLNNTGVPGDPGSELFLLDIDATRELSPAAFEVTSIATPADTSVGASSEARESDEGWLGAASLSFILIVAISLLARLRRRP